MYCRRRPYAAVLSVACLAFASLASAHCDSLDGPVVRDARIALEKHDPAAVLKWVKPQDEALIRAAFSRAVAVRALGGDARQLAEQYFFETLVRIHRAGEGEAFTGLKPAGSIDPGIKAADGALETNSGDAIAKQLSEGIEEGTRRRFEAAARHRKRADDSVAAGREYVEAYVEYVHFVESVHHLVAQGAAHVHSEAKDQP